MGSGLRSRRNRGPAEIQDDEQALASVSAEEQSNSRSLGEVASADALDLQERAMTTAGARGDSNSQQLD